MNGFVSVTWDIFMEAAYSVAWERLPANTVALIRFNFIRAHLPPVRYRFMTLQVWGAPEIVARIVP